MDEAFVCFFHMFGFRSFDVIILTAVLLSFIFHKKHLCETERKFFLYHKLHEFELKYNIRICRQYSREGSSVHSNTKNQNIFWRERTILSEIFQNYLNHDLLVSIHEDLRLPLRFKVKNF